MRWLGERLGDERQQQGRRVASPSSSRLAPGCSGAAAALLPSWQLLLASGRCGASVE